MYISGDIYIYIYKYICIYIYIYIYIYICNHKNNMPSPRLSYNEFVTTHVLWHMACR